MKIRTFLFLLLLLPITSNANDYKVDGFDIRIYWKAKQGKLRVWGDIQEGRECSNIDFDIKLKNRRNGHGIILGTITKEHYPNSRTAFSMRSRKYSSIERKGWQVSNIWLDCNNIK